MIAATNHDLAKAVEKGRFRSDLYYRLKVFPISMPPLRERRDDIPTLIRFLLDRQIRRLGKKITNIPAKVIEKLQSYDWPGNVRELEGVLERAIIVSKGATLTLTEDFRDSGPTETPPDPSRLEDVERDHILRVLAECRGVIKGTGNAAERLGLKPSTLRDRMKKLGIEALRR